VATGQFEGPAPIRSVLLLGRQEEFFLIVEAPLAEQKHGQGIIRAGAMRVQRDRLAQRSFGSLCVIQLHLGCAQQEIGVRVIRVQFDGALKMHNALGKVLLRVQEFGSQLELP